MSRRTGSADSWVESNGSHGRSEVSRHRLLSDQVRVLFGRLMAGATHVCDLVTTANVLQTALLWASRACELIPQCESMAVTLDQASLTLSPRSSGGSRNDLP